MNIYLFLAVVLFLILILSSKSCFPPMWISQNFSGYNYEWKKAKSSNIVQKFGARHSVHSLNSVLACYWIAGPNTLLALLKLNWFGFCFWFLGTSIFSVTFTFSFFTKYEDTALHTKNAKHWLPGDGYLWDRLASHS